MWTGGVTAPLSLQGGGQEMMVLTEQQNASAIVALERRAYSSEHAHAAHAAHVSHHAHRLHALLPS